MFFSLLIFLGGNWLAVHLYGPQYAGNGLIIFVLTLSFAAGAAGFAFSAGFFAAGRGDLDLRISWVYPAILIACGLPLVRSFGLIGGAASLLIAHTLASSLRGAQFLHFSKGNWLPGSMTTDAQFVDGRSSASGKSMPWAHMAYLTICFFLAAHDPLASTWDVNRPSEAYALTAGSGSVSRQISFLMLAVYAIAHIPAWRGHKLQRQSAVAVAALLLCLWTFLSVSWTDSLAASGARLLGLLALILVASAVCLQFRPKDVVRWVGFATVLFAVTGVICELALGTFRPFASDYRFADTLHPNEQGVNCAIAAIAAWHLWRRSFW